MSEATAAKITAILRALSPLRIVLIAIERWFAPSGPGRKITLAVIYAETALRMLPMLTSQPAAVEYLVMGLVVVFGGSTLTQGLVKDRIKQSASNSPEPGGTP